MITITKDDVSKLVKPGSGSLAVKPKASKILRDRDNIDLLDKAEQCWDALRDFRERRKRTRDYRMGYQWDDMVTDPDNGDTITEDELIRRNGKVPLKQNIIGQLSNSFLGQYRTNPAKPIVIARTRDKQQESEMITVNLEAVLQNNGAKHKDAMAINEFILSGLPIQKLTWSYFKEKDRKDIRLSNVKSENIFFNPDITEQDGSDLTLIGERIECYIEDIIAAFAKNEKQAEEIREIYGHAKSDYYGANGPTRDRVDNVTFLEASEESKVVMFEVWYLEPRWSFIVHDYLDGSDTVSFLTRNELEAENINRLKLAAENNIPQEQVGLLDYEPHYELVWRVKYLSPYGDCFKEMDTPYLHDEHPYIFNAYPMLDGEIWGFLYELIDQQRYINRLITLWDFIISSSAKGLLMIEEGMIPTHLDPESFAIEYKKHNGLLIYKAKPGMEKPQWLTQNSVNVGIQEMLSLQLKLINDISGINSALQGQQAASGTPASRYAMESQNASLNILDKMECFDAGIERRNYKIIKLILQFHKEERYNSIVGQSYDEEVKLFDPNKIKGLEFDTAIARGKDTPSYRLLMDDLLMQLMQLPQGQAIDIKMYLGNISAPWADKLLKQIEAKEQQSQNLMQQLPPELMQQVAQNPQAMQQVMQGANPMFSQAINQ